MSVNGFRHFKAATLTSVWRFDIWLKPASTLTCGVVAALNRGGLANMPCWGFLSVGGGGGNTLIVQGNINNIGKIVNSILIF
ncbi:MAG: hypothetical protein OEX14_00185 [Paracoccaceae bacterium]|nr:hypothetical protein [Paracoccaceae bacterium]